RAESSLPRSVRPVVYPLWTAGDGGYPRAQGWVITAFYRPRGAHNVRPMKGSRWRGPVSRGVAHGTESPRSAVRVVTCLLCHDRIRDAVGRRTERCAAGPAHRQRDGPADLDGTNRSLPGRYGGSDR